MNNVFKGIQFSKEEKIHEWTSLALVSGTKTKEILLVVFTRFCVFLEGVFCRISPISLGKNGRSGSLKLLNLFGHIGDGAKRFSVLLLRYSGNGDISNGDCFCLLNRY